MTLSGEVAFIKTLYEPWLRELTRDSLTHRQVGNALVERLDELTAQVATLEARVSAPAPDGIRATIERMGKLVDRISADLDGDPAAALARAKELPTLAELPSAAAGNVVAFRPRDGGAA